jgi:hypothetical protein
MWKKFKYSGRERVAFIPEEGPAYQVLDAGKPVKGFRAFKMEEASEVSSTANMFQSIPEDVVLEYPELEAANG